MTGLLHPLAMIWGCGARSRYGWPFPVILEDPSAILLTHCLTSITFCPSWSLWVMRLANASRELPLFFVSKIHRERLLTLATLNAPNRLPASPGCCQGDPPESEILSKRSAFLLQDVNFHVYKQSHSFCSPEEGYYISQAVKNPGCQTHTL